MVARRERGRSVQSLGSLRPFRVLSVFLSLVFQALIFSTASLARAPFHTAFPLLPSSPLYVPWTRARVHAARKNSLVHSLTPGAPALCSPFLSSPPDLPPSHRRHHPRVLVLPSRLRVSTPKAATGGVDVDTWPSSAVTKCPENGGQAACINAGLRARASYFTFIDFPFCSGRWCESSSVITVHISGSDGGVKRREPEARARADAPATLLGFACGTDERGTR